MTSAAAKMQERNRRILLVEDNPSDEALTLEAFRSYGITDQIDIVRDGQEAIDHLFAERLDNIPDVVLLDLKLPRLSGLEVLKRIRSDARTRLLPVVIFTSSEEDQDRLASYDFGANSYIKKPVNFREFQEAVAQFGHYWLAWNEFPPR